MAQAHRTTAPSPAPLVTAFQIWLARPALYGPPVGFLIAPTDKPHQPIALVVTPGGWDEDNALHLARHLTQSPHDPWNRYPTSSPTNDTAYVVDLRPYGKPGSPAPLPQCLYGLTIIPVDEEGEPASNAPPRNLWPVCWHRYKHLKELINSTLPTK
jgi:hypothetical protein